MPASAFKFIEQYRTLAKGLEEQTCDDLITMDQEVPHTRFVCEDIDMKSQVKTESTADQQDFCSFLLMDNYVNYENNNSGSLFNTDSGRYSTSNNIINSSSSKIQPISSSCDIPPVSPSKASDFLGLPTDPSFLFSSSTPTSSSTLVPSSLSSSSSLQQSSFSVLPPSTVQSSNTVSSSSPFHSPLSSSTLTSSPSMPVFSSLMSSGSNSISSSGQTTKTSTYVTELGGSGCTLVSTDFLLSPVPASVSSTTCTPPPSSTPDDSLEYTDLDHQPVSLYDDDLGPFSGMVKPAVVSEEVNSVSIEEAAIVMRDVICSDSDSLNIPYDPRQWTPDHVKTWTSWVCQRNNMEDISCHLSQVDGPALCSIHPSFFTANYGEVGTKLANELDLWTAANSCFPTIWGADEMPSSTCPTPPQQQSQLFGYTDGSQNFPQMPHCISPAPSTCSFSPDSSSSNVSLHSDNSDDENVYVSCCSKSTTSSTCKIPTGRGHKQTIHLWQFLKELLVSKDNHTDCIRWLDRKAGVFKIEDSKKVAHLWGVRKNRPAMNYDKLSRSVRQYYRKGIIKKTEQSKRLVYQFCAPYL